MMKLEIEVPKHVVERVLRRISIISERSWSKDEVKDFITQDVSNLYEAMFEDYLDSAIMEDDKFVRKNLLPSHGLS